jgi:hypothetical protein
MSVVEAVTAVDAAVATIAALDFTQCPDRDVRDGLAAIVQTHNRLMAQVTRLIGEFDRRELCHADTQRSTKAWLKAFTRLGGAQAHGMIKSVATLKLLPSLDAAFESGDTSFDTVNQIRLLQDKEPDELLKAAEPILTALATQGDPDEMRTATHHLQHRVHEPDPDDPEAAAREHEKEFAKRQLTCTRLGPHWRISGQLDAETGTALHAVLQGLMAAPKPEEVRTVAQRRHDAFADLLNRMMREGQAGSTSAGRTQLGLLVPWALMQELLRRRHAAPYRAAGSESAPHGAATVDVAESDAVVTTSEPDEPSDASDPANTTSTGSTSGEPLAPSALGGPAVNGAALAGLDLDDLRRKQGPPPSMSDFGTEPAYLQGYGPIPHAMAERLACDADIYRILLAPDGQPMDVGRTRRLPPPWIRKALNYRDRGCRWPGCDTEVPYTDAHHYRHWTPHNGNTSVDNLILLCRYHHMRVHEGHWDLQFDPATSQIVVTRPDGTPYELGPTEPWNSANTRRDAPPPPSTPSAQLDD